MAIRKLFVCVEEEIKVSRVMMDFEVSRGEEARLVIGRAGGE